MTAEKQVPVKAKIPGTKDASVKHTSAIKCKQNAATTKTLVKRPVSTKPIIKTVTAVVNKTPVKTVLIKQSKTHNKAKTTKVKMARDSFTMPKDEYTKLSLLKLR